MRRFLIHQRRRVSGRVWRRRKIMDRLVAVVSWLVDGEHPRLHARPARQQPRRREKEKSGIENRGQRTKDKRPAKAMPARKNVVKGQNDWQ